MAKYRVIATRLTIYELNAATADDAIVDFEDTDEVDQHTTSFEALPLCPTCGAELTDRTTRTVVHDGIEKQEPSYCDTCDREIAADEDLPLEERAGFLHGTGPKEN
jgi:hypothetical protein